MKKVLLVLAALTLVLCPMVVTGEEIVAKYVIVACYEHDITSLIVNAVNENNASGLPLDGIADSAASLVQLGLCTAVRPGTKINVLSWGKEISVGKINGDERKLYMPTELITNEDRTKYPTQPEQHSTPNTKSPDVNLSAQPSKTSVGIIQSLHTAKSTSTSDIGKRLTPSVDDMKLFITNYFKANETKDMDKVLAFYADTIDYYAKGRISKNDIKKDKEIFFNFCRKLLYSLADDLRVIKSNNSETVTLEFTYSFIIESTSNKLIKSTVKNVWDIENPNSNPRIILEKQTVIDRKESKIVGSGEQVESMAFSQGDVKPMNPLSDAVKSLKDENQNLRAENIALKEQLQQASSSISSNDQTVGSRPDLRSDESGLPPSAKNLKNKHWTVPELRTACLHQNRAKIKSLLGPPDKSGLAWEYYNMTIYDPDSEKDLNTLMIHYYEESVNAESFSVTCFSLR